MQGENSELLSRMVDPLFQLQLFRAAAGVTVVAQTTERDNDNPGIELGKRLNKIQQTRRPKAAQDASTLSPFAPNKQLPYS